MARHVPTPSQIAPGDVDGGLSLDETDHLRHRIFRGNRDQHMNVIRHQMTFFDTTLPLLGQGVKDLTQMMSQFLVKRLATVLWNKYDMILARPLRMA